MDHKARDCRPNDYNDQEAFALYLQWGLLQRSLGALFQCIENFITKHQKAPFSEKLLNTYVNPAPGKRQSQ